MSASREAGRRSLDLEGRSFADGLVRVCANAVLVTALMPYVSPFVLPDMDVQLMALGTSTAILLLLLLLAPRVFSFAGDDFLILAMGLLSLVYVNPDVAFDDLPAALRACGQIVLAFPVYYAVRNLYRYMSPRVFLAVVALYCGVLFLQMSFPGAYAATFAHMLSDTRWFADEGRGPNGLCTEPSMMGSICMLFIVSLYFFHRGYWKTHRNAARFVVTASCLMLVITKSGTGVVLALVVALAALFNSKLSGKSKAALLAAFFLAMISLGRILSSSESRGASILSGIAGNPLSILDEYSFADRTLGIYVGLHQIPDKPFGSMDVRIDPEATNSALNGDAAILLWPDSSFRALLNDLRALRYNNHGTGALLERMGIPGVLILATLVLYPRGFHGHWVVRAFMAGMLLNATLFISTLWFVLGCTIELRRTEADAPKEAAHGFFHTLWREIARPTCTEALDER
ncbi:MAG: hypothetical protein WBE72_16960 [Terracidiphilus sp.]